MSRFIDHGPGCEGLTFGLIALLKSLVSLSLRKELCLSSALSFSLIALARRVFCNSDLSDQSFTITSQPHAKDHLRIVRIGFCPRLFGRQIDAIVPLTSALRTRFICQRFVTWPNRFHQVYGGSSFEAAAFGVSRLERNCKGAATKITSKSVGHQELLGTRFTPLKQSE